MIGIKQRQAYFTELPIHTVHLWKSRNIASKGYIHCTCRVNLLNQKYWFTLIEILLKLTIQTVTEHRTTNADRWCEYPNSYVTTTSLFWKIRVISNKDLTSWSSVVDHLSSRLDPRVLRLDPCILKLKKFELRDMRIESQVASFECQLTFQPYCISFLVVLTLIQYDNLSP